MRTEQSPGGAADRPRPLVAYWKATAGFVALVVIVVSAAFMVNSRLRPSVGIEPAATEVATPQAVPSVEPTASASLPTEQEILDAYRRFWQVRSDAYLNLDPSHLSEVMADPGLAAETAQLLEYKSRGRAVKADVEHHPVIVHLTADRATVYDEYVNRNLLLDAKTGEPVNSNVTPKTEKISYEMAKYGQTWKVFDGAQHP